MYIANKSFAYKNIYATAGEVVKSKDGAVLIYLEEKGLITKKEALRKRAEKKETEKDNGEKN